MRRGTEALLAFVVVTRGDGAIGVCKTIYPHLIPIERLLKHHQSLPASVPPALTSIFYLLYTVHVSTLEIAHNLSLHRAFLSPVDDSHLLRTEDLKHDVCYGNLDPWIRIRRQHT